LLILINATDIKDPVFFGNDHPIIGSAGTVVRNPSIEHNEETTLNRRAVGQITVNIVGASKRWDSHSQDDQSQNDQRLLYRSFSFHFSNLMQRAANHPATTEAKAWI
jgi:hypothetical protein